MSAEKNARRREARKRKRQENLSEALKECGGWTKHNMFHWSKSVNGLKIDYWPSTRKAQFNGVVYKQVANINDLIEHLKGQ